MSLTQLPVQALRVKVTAFSNVFESHTMSKKNPFDPSAMSDNVKEQAQQIWLAGLGAFSKAQQEGTKAFEKLVSDGITMQRKVHTTAEEKLAEATQKVTEAAQTLNERATGQWGKLENIFEDRVAKALQGLGVPSAQELKALQERVAALEAQLNQVGKPVAAKPATAKKTAAAPKASAKPAAKASTKPAAKTAAKAPAKSAKN
jgi:poly(hydroxyalkanoate) granule-associated protein